MSKPTTRYPSMSKPSVQPPNPQNKSIANGFICSEQVNRYRGDPRARPLTVMTGAYRFLSRCFVLLVVLGGRDPRGRRRRARTVLPVAGDRTAALVPSQPVASRR